MFSKKNILIPYLTVFLFLSVFLTECSSKAKEDDDVVARIGDKYEYTFNDLRKYVFDWSYDKRFRINLTEGYSAALDSMVTNQLKRIDFFARGLNKDKDLVQRIRRIIGEEVVIEYYNRQYLSKYTNDEYAEKIYSIADRQVRYQRILLKLPLNASKQQKDSVEKKSLDIRDEIINGKDFGELARQYSQDSLSRNTNGFVAPIGWEQSLLDPMGEVIFNLKTGDVRILNTVEGYYIIKAAEELKLELKAFEEIKDEIKSKLKNIYTDKALVEFYEDKARLVDSSAIIWNTDALRKLAEWSEIQGFYFYVNLYQDTLKNAISKNNLTILTYPDGRVDLKEYLRLLENVLLPRFSAEVTREDIKAFIIEAMQTDKVYEKAESLGIEDSLFNINTDNKILKSQMTILYNKAVVDTQIPEPTEEMLQEFYNEQKDTLYYLLHKVNIYAMVFPDENQANEVMQMIKEGTPFEKISGRWLVKTFVRERDGNIKSYLSKEEPYLGKAAMALNLNETSGVLKYYDAEKGDQYAVIKCVNIRPEKQLSYADVKKTIAGDFRVNKREIIMKEVRAQLWKKYKAEIYLDVVLKKLNPGANNSIINKTEN